MLEISKAHMEFAIKQLERKAAEITDVPMFYRVPVAEFEKKEHLVMLCKVFAEEWGKTRELNNSLLGSTFDSPPAYYKEKARNFLQKAIDDKERGQSIRSRIWNKIRRV